MGLCDALLLMSALQMILSERAKDTRRQKTVNIKYPNADNLAFSYSIIPARAEWGQVKDNKQVMPLLDAAANAINSAHW